jgi:hypothetical protein
MTRSTLIAAALAVVLAPAILASAGPALARAPAPLVATALVEDVKSTSAELEFMDYVGTGQVIKLAPTDVLVLSYLKSCAYETITGGTVSVGAEQSDVTGGTIARAKVACNGGNMKLSSAQANSGGASSFRLQNVAFDPMLYALSPMIQIPKLAADDSRTLTIQRADKRGKRLTIEIDASLAAGGFYDMEKEKKRLIRGTIYTATLGSRKVTFKIDAKAKSGKTPVVSRLLRFPAG